MACRILILCLSLLATTAAADCRDRGILIDQRSPAQAQTDQSEGRLRCVRFVLDARTGAGSYGWVAWHHERTGQATSSHRLGLFPVDGAGGMAFGRVPEALDAGNAPLNVTVLLPTPRWWLVNTTRQGWQLRSGTVSEPGMETLRKLFTDVALNAGLADQALLLDRWWP